MAEISLFDKRGKPIAYIADDGESTIYLWDGRPVAYLHDEHVYGFNGKHLGWYENGVVRDSEGAKIGFTRETCPSVTSLEPLKGLKALKHLKSLRTLPPLRPVDKLGTSDQDLEEFLLGRAK